MVLAYLYGSVATGKTHARSDIDIAVATDRKLSAQKKLDVRLVLIAGCQKILQTPNIDLVFYEDLPLQVQYHALQDSALIFSGDENLRVDLEHRTLSRYFDREYYIRRHTELLLHNVSTHGILS